MKCTMADKSTRTDDTLLNGESEPACPTTTNAATMTTSVSCESPARSGAQQPSSPQQSSASQQATITTTSHVTRVSHVATQAPRPADRQDVPPKQPSTPPPPLVNLV